jgi:hypothetical protein
MGRRSRKRAPAAPPAPAPPPPRTAPRPAPLTDERPKAPWHPFPLVELCALVGIVLIVFGFLDLESDRGRSMLVFGLALASLAGLDTAVREHFAGFRSHTTVLAGLPTVLAATAVFFSGAPWIAVVGAAGAVFAVALLYFGRAFRRRSGGPTFR